MLEMARKGGTTTRDRRRAIVRRVDEFEAALRQRLGEGDPIRLAIAEAATALYEAILLHRRTCLNPYRGTKPGDILALSAAVTNLNARLAQLGLTPIAATDPDAPPPADAPIEQRQAWSRRYVDRVMNDLETK